MQSKQFDRDTHVPSVCDPFDRLANAGTPLDFLVVDKWIFLASFRFRFRFRLSRAVGRRKGESDSEIMGGLMYIYKCVYYLVRGIVLGSSLISRTTCPEIYLSEV